MRFVLALAVLAVVAVACASEESENAPYGCCEIGASPPPPCVLIYGGTRRFENDTCNLGADGTIPDPNQPGWTKVPDENGCPVWTPPAGAKTICCGCTPVVDASAD